MPATIYGQVTTFAGNGVPGNMDGTGTAASFNDPTRVGLDAAGNLYVADRDNNVYFIGNISKRLYGYCFCNY
ncbi:hypothetical protein [Mucilaginibacter lappiensis]|uniref:hypothetical protein n=1 Tax=Mucilaginibacter lappiensis TaxID=354630 RepID=UPI003D1FD245